jgi:hypothetical protein
MAARHSIPAGRTQAAETTFRLRCAVCGVVLADRTGAGNDREESERTSRRCRASRDGRAQPRGPTRARASPGSRRQQPSRRLSRDRRTRPQSQAAREQRIGGMSPAAQERVRANAALEHTMGGSTTRDDLNDLGVPMTQGGPDEPAGPEDALGDLARSGATTATASARPSISRTRAANLSDRGLNRASRWAGNPRGSTPADRRLKENKGLPPKQGKPAPKIPRK